MSDSVPVPAAVDLAQLHLGVDDFTLFAWPPHFEVDLSALSERWKQLQSLCHPDRFAAQGAAQQRVAMQWSVRINEAYQRLKDPITRAAYWCELQGVAVQAHSNTHMPEAFLLQQMQWREALEEAATEADLTALLAQTQQARANGLSRLQQAIDAQPNPIAAVAEVRALMFVQRFAQEVRARLDQY